MKLDILQYARHRNGIDGAPFEVLLFRDTEEGVMLAILFEQQYHVAVLNVDKLIGGDIAFRSNSWRGDKFEPKLRRAVTLLQAHLEGENDRGGI